MDGSFSCIVVEKALEAENPAHYSFCGPPKVAELAPSTIILNFNGQPAKNTLKSSLESLSKSMANLPEDVANRISELTNQDETGDDNPEGLAISALFGVSMALSAYKRRKSDGESSTLQTPKFRKMRENV